MQSEGQKDPFRTIAAIHIDSDRVSFSLISEARLIWFTSVAVARTPNVQNPKDWDCLGPTFQYVFSRAERILMDNRPYSFLINIYTNFREQAWKFVFVNADFLASKFSGASQSKATSSWLLQDPVRTVPELSAKLEKYPHRKHVEESICIYLAYVCPKPHVESCYPVPVHILCQK